jgi:hypothetical protein
MQRAGLGNQGQDPAVWSGQGRPLTPVRASGGEGTFGSDTRGLPQRGQPARAQASDLGTRPNIRPQALTGREESWPRGFVSPFQGFRQFLGTVLQGDTLGWRVSALQAEDNDALRFRQCVYSMHR